MNIEKQTQWGRLLLIVGVGMAGAFQVGKAPPVLPLLRAELGLSLVLAGWVLSAFNVVGAALSPVAGALSDRFGHRRSILFGLICMAAGSFVGSFSGEATTLLLTRFLEGLGYIVVIISAPGLILRIVHARDTRVAFGIWGAFMPAGGATMMVLAPLLVTGFGWRGMWLINAGLLIGFMIWLTFATRDLPGPRKKERKPFRQLWKDMRTTVKTPGPVLLALCFTCYAFQFLVVMGFLPTLLMEEQGLNQGPAAVLSAIALAMNVPGNLLGGWLLQRGVKRWALIALASLIMGGCSFGIFPHGLTLSTRYLGALFFMSAGGMIPASALHGATVHAPRRELVATTNGFLMQGAQIGLLSGPPIVAAAVSHSGNWQSAPRILVLAAILCMVLAILIRSVEKQKRIA